MTSEEYKEQLSEALGKLAGVHAVGDTWITFDGSIPAGGVPFTGQLVTRAMYADLWAWVQANKTVQTDAEWQATANAQNGMNAAYSSGDGSTTFRLPCVVGGYLCAGDTSTAGQYVKEGLPNITGAAWHLLAGSASYKGAFGNGGDNADIKNGTSTPVTGKILDFNASRCSSVYRDDCQHVTPETFKVMVGVYAFGVTGPVGESTAAGLVSEMNRKADIDASNFSTAGKNVLAGMGMPSNRFINLTLGATGTKYTAPANGWFCLKLQATAAGQWASIQHEAFQLDSDATSNGRYMGLMMPVRKGVQATVYYADGVNTQFFRFFYAEGAE